MNSFDSDKQSNSSNPEINFSIDAQMISNQNTQYHETIEDLRKQNTILKAQFDQALIVSQQIDSVHERNLQLSNQVRSLQAENENLQRRIEICIRHQEEAETQLENERASRTQQIMEINSEKEVELSKVQKQCNAKIETLMIRLQQFDDSKEKDQLENKMLSSKIEKLVEAANEYFKMTFDGIDTVTDFLSQPVGFDCANPSANDKKSDSESKKRKNDKAKLKVLKHHCSKLVSQVNELKNEIHRSEVAYEKSKKKSEEEIQKLKEDLDLTQNDNKEALNLLKEKNQSLKAEIQKLRNEAMDEKTKLKIPVNPPTSPSLNEQTLSRELANAKAENENFAQINQELNEKFRHCEQSNYKLNSKLKQAKEIIGSLQDSINGLETEKQAAESLQNEHEEELKKLREQLKEKSQVKPNKELKVIQKLKGDITRLENQIESQTKQLHESQLQIENGKHEKSTLSANIKSIKAENEELLSRIASLNDELAEVNERLSQKPEIDPQEVMPDSAFRCKDFQTELAPQIENIIHNSYLTPPSKLSHIYSLILKFYNEKLKEKNDAVNHMSEHYKQIREQVNKFLVDLSIGLSFDALTFDEFIVHGAQKLLDKIYNNIKLLEEARRKNAQLNSIVAHVANELGYPADFSSKLTSICPELTQRFQNAEQIAKKYKECKEDSKDRKRSLTSKLVGMKKENLELNNIIEQVQNENQNLNSINNKLKNDLQTARAEIIAIKRTMEQNAEDLQDEHQHALDSITKQHSVEQLQLQSQINKMKGENANAQKILADHEASFNKMKKVMENNQRDLQACKEEFDIYKQEKDAEIECLVHKYEKEKKHLIKTYGNAISEITKKCEDQRQDYSQLSQELKAEKEKSQQIINSAAKIKRENQKLEGTIKILEEQIQRDQSLAEASIKNQILSIETEYNQQLNDAKAKIESEKRRIISYAIEEFRNYCGSSKNFDERTYRSLLCKVKQELEQLSQSDANIRRMTGAYPRQPTEQAVAKYLSPV